MRIEKNWGYEEIVHNDGYCMKLLVYTKRIASSLHYHLYKHETFYVASGSFQIDDGNKLYQMPTGWSVVLAPNTPHRVRCLEPGIIVEASTFASDNDCIRLIPSESL